MSVIATVTGVTSQTVNTTDNCFAIQIHMTKAAGVNFTAPSCSIYVKSRTSGKRFTSNETAPIIKIAEFSTCDLESAIETEGVDTITAPGGGGACTVARTTETVICRIDLTGDRAGILTNVEDILQIELSNLDAAATYTIYGLESDQVSKSPISYDVSSTEARPNQKVYVQDADFMLIDRTNNLTSIEIGYLNGKKVKYLPFEIDENLRNGFGVVYRHAALLDAGTSLYTTREQSLSPISYILAVRGVEYVQLNTNSNSVNYYLQRIP